MPPILNQDHGYFLFSFDLELYWGMRDKVKLADYRRNLEGTRVFIPGVLDRFAEKGVKGTWAAVGFLFFRTKAELESGLPKIKPNYREKRFSPFADFDDIGIDEAADPYRFGRSLIEKIKKTPGQEIASHTFSHYYCLEDGQTAEEFAADLKAMQAAAAGVGVKIASLVFPRNQLNADYLEICRRFGILAFRGNESSWLYSERPDGKEAKIRRAVRLADAYLNLSGSQTYVLPADSSWPVNLPASRFLRPVPRRFLFLEKLKLKRIVEAMETAAREKRIFHLWTHPHNHGFNPARGLDTIDKILLNYEILRKQYGFESATMGELAGIIKNKRQKGV